MKVTDLKQQVARPSRISVYVDGKFAFGFSADALLSSGLVVGEELDEERLTALKELAGNDKAYNNALNYVALRPRSEWEVVTYLRRKQVDAELIDTIVERLRGIRLLDDLTFARAWVTNRRLLRATNKRRLADELKRKRIASSIIETVLAEDETDETQVLRELVAKKRQIPRYRDDLKLMQYLARQGYDYDAIKTALRESDDA